MKSYYIRKVRGIKPHKCKNCGDKGFVIFRSYKLCSGCLNHWRSGNSLKCGLKYIPIRDR